MSNELTHLISIRRDHMLMLMLLLLTKVIVYDLLVWLMVGRFVAVFDNFGLVLLLVNRVIRVIIGRSCGSVNIGIDHGC
jgi:hypothetical protein